MEVTFWAPDQLAKNGLLYTVLDLLHEGGLGSFLRIVQLCVFVVFEEQQDQAGYSGVDEKNSRG